MALFTVNKARVDPYKNYRFRVKWDGRYVLGFSKVSMLKRSTRSPSIARATCLVPS